MRLKLLAVRLAVCRLDPGEPVPAWAASSEFFCATRRPTELSLVCEERLVPAEVKAERGWRALGVAGTLDFALVGVLLALAQPLAAAGVSIFAISTFDTDFVLVKQDMLDRALAALRAAGHVIEE